MCRPISSRRALSLEEAARLGAQLAVLPENFAFMGLADADKRAMAEPEGSGPIQDFLSRTALRLQMWIVGGTIPLRAGPDGRVAAACVVYRPDGTPAARYDKIHLFDVDIPARKESYRESAHVAPGLAPAARGYSGGTPWTVGVLRHPLPRVVSRSERGRCADTLSAFRVHRPHRACALGDPAARACDREPLLCRLPLRNRGFTPTGGRPTATA